MAPCSAKNSWQRPGDKRTDGMCVCVCARACVWCERAEERAREEGGVLQPHLFLLKSGCCVDVLENLCHVGFEDHPPHHNLIKNVMHSLDVEDQVELAHVLKSLVKRLDKDLRWVG
jgi:hypothetical protein